MSTKIFRVVATESECGLHPTQTRRRMGHGCHPEEGNAILREFRALSCRLQAYLVYQLVELGVSMLERVEGPHYTFIDPRYHEDTPSMVRQAVRLVRLFVEKGIGRDRIVVTVSRLRLRLRTSGS